MHNTSTLQAASHALYYTSPVGLTTVVVQRNSPPLTGNVRGEEVRVSVAPVVLRLANRRNGPANAYR
jgi:hypothetical protein